MPENAPGRGGPRKGPVCARAMQGIGHCPEGARMPEDGFGKGPVRPRAELSHSTSNGSLPKMPEGGLGKVPEGRGASTLLSIGGRCAEEKSLMLANDPFPLHI